MAPKTNFYNFHPLGNDGKEYDLSLLRGKTVLIVNTASKCALGPQLQDLQVIYDELTSKYPGKFEILAFPCNQFAAREPGTDSDIQSVCQLRFNASYPIMKKVDVNGNAEEPLYGWMKSEAPGLFGMKRIMWNFEKFLISPSGEVKGRWMGTTKPASLTGAIRKEIAA